MTETLLGTPDRDPNWHKDVFSPSEIQELEIAFEDVILSFIERGPIPVVFFVSADEFEEFFGQMHAADEAGFVIGPLGLAFGLEYLTNDDIPKNPTCGAAVAYFMEYDVQAEGEDDDDDEDYD